MDDSYNLVDIAHAQLIGFRQAQNNPNSIIELVQAMALTKEEWNELKKRYFMPLRKSDVEEINNYFNEV